MTEPTIITGATAGGTLYAAVNPGAGRMGAIGRSEVTARLAPYRSLADAVVALVMCDAVVEDQWRNP